MIRQGSFLTVVDRQVSPYRPSRCTFWQTMMMIMRTMPIEQVEGHLAEVIETLPPGEELLITRGNKPVAKLVGEDKEQPRPVFGRGKGMLTIISEDDEHLKDFAGYMR
jgi:antitoxin (DNA-binding transcriptional repressor) of toxin-antitoxin stability system